MKRRTLLWTGGAAALGVGLAEILPRLAWRHSLASNTDAYTDVLNLAPNWDDLKGTTGKAVEIDPIQVAGLAYRKAQRFIVTGPHSSAMELLYLEYGEGNPRYFEDLFYHLPERCMAAAGKVTEQIFRVVTIEQTDIEVRCVTFREFKSERQLHVYKAIWLHRTYPVTMGPGLHRKKVQAGLSLKPCPPARMLMAAVQGAESEPEAWKLFEELGLSRLKQRNASEGEAGT